MRRRWIAVAEWALGERRLHLVGRRREAELHDRKPGLTISRHAMIDLGIDALEFGDDAPHVLGRTDSDQWRAHFDIFELPRIAHHEERLDPDLRARMAIRHQFGNRRLLEIRPDGSRL